MLLRPIKRFKEGSLCNFKEKKIRSGVLFMFLIKTWKFKKITEKLTFGGKNKLFF